MPPPIPIIILNWNGLEDTRECLASLEEQSYSNYRVYLIDNGSEEAEVAELKRHYSDNPRIVLRFNDQNLGFTRGNNQVLREILTEHPELPQVVLLNNDTTLDRQWLATLIRTAGDHPGQMVTSKMINYFDRERMDNAGHQLLNTLEVLPIGNEDSVQDHTTVRENVGPCAGAALYPTEMLREIGTFDEHFTNGYEDVELGLRGIVCGYRSVYAPEAVVYHKVSRSVNKIRDFEYTLNIQKHIYYIIAKLIPAGAFWVCFPFLLFRTLAGLAVNTLFFRKKYLRIQLQALRWVFMDGRHLLRSTRRQFFAQHRVISSLEMIRKMDFFLKKDLQRFYKYLIRGEKMVFEKYD
ncbi:glycosyltransferase family 2 protein [Flavilitoribacter nigricans]|uniref:Glycosyltransferase 2-like domain-containing protein n=1 Tax=Flavilitoribacter nigricans (strain ATCC 23147 / DSM 23189 / NBRC 102662 / NCIMB 1420 / SS-2) TaxID=1122177 RepID=A0A2D0ND62_FLAN2|nr:glycosyltransferase family 2 protein [Flavilitoribacter nigricans]PHN06454.1 hypothetical protein CRP01_12870 [Flavilitoribacter nigricans DSM 23189 = NBRC 102662]